MRAGSVKLGRIMENVVYFGTLTLCWVMVPVGVVVAVAADDWVIQVLGGIAAVVGVVVCIAVLRGRLAGRTIRLQERRSVVGGVAGSEGVVVALLAAVSATRPAMQAVLYVIAVLCAMLGVIYGVDWVKKRYGPEFAGYGAVSMAVDGGVVTAEVLGQRVGALVDPACDLVSSADGTRLCIGGGYHLGNIFVWSEDERGACVSCGLLYPGKASKGPRNAEMLERVLSGAGQTA